MTKTATFVTIVAALLVACPTALADPAAEASAGHAEAIFKQYKLAGFAVAVSRGGQVVFTGYFGHANVEHEVWRMRTGCRTARWNQPWPGLGRHSVGSTPAVVRGRTRRRKSAGAVRPLPRR